MGVVLHRVTAVTVVCHRPLTLLGRAQTHLAAVNIDLHCRISPTSLTDLFAVIRFGTITCYKYYLPTTATVCITAAVVLLILFLHYNSSSCCTKRHVHLVWFYTLSVSERQLLLSHRRHPGVVPARHAFLPARLEGVKTRKKKHFVKIPQCMVVPRYKTVEVRQQRENKYTKVQWYNSTVIQQLYNSSRVVVVVLLESTVV